MVLPVPIDRSILDESLPFSVAMGPRSRGSVGCGNVQHLPGPRKGSLRAAALLDSAGQHSRAGRFPGWTFPALGIPALGLPVLSLPAPGLFLSRGFPCWVLLGVGPSSCSGYLLAVRCLRWSMAAGLRSTEGARREVDWSVSDRPFDGGSELLVRVAVGGFPGLPFGAWGCLWCVGGGSCVRGWRSAGF